MSFTPWKLFLLVLFLCIFTFAYHVFDSIFTDRSVQLKQVVINHGNDIKHHQPNHYDETYISSYDNWIRGIGDRFLVNNLSSAANCLFPSIPASVEHNQAINNDYTFETIKKHKQQRFSTILERVISAKCAVNPLYEQSNSIFNAKIPDVNTMNMMPNSSKINGSHVWILSLNRRTQTTWISCSKTFDLHFSLLSLSTLNATQYNEKKQRIHDHFAGKRPPNVILFVLDATSRAQFIRSSPRTVDYLSNLMLDHNVYNPQSASDVYEFYRYSTVSWGTSFNMPALIGGTCAHCDEHTKFKRCKGLNTFYDQFGYYVVGMEEYLANIDSGTFQIFSWEDRNDPTTNDNQNKFKAKYHIPRSVDLLDFTQNFSKIFGNDDALDEKMRFIESLETYQRLDSLHCDYYLSGNVFPRKIQHRFDTELAAEFALQMINELQLKRDKDVPYFMVLHTHANHGTNNAFYLDRYLADMLEMIDKQNTVIHLIADHGSYQTKGIFGELEARNPVSILIAPKAIGKAINQNNNLYENQQKMVTHYDMHLFYKELLYNLLANKTDYDSTIAAYLPRSNDGKILSESIISTRIKSDRSCDGIEHGFCLCDSLTIKQPKNDGDLMEVIINKINQMTGNGQYMCRKLDANDFVMTSHIEAHETKAKYITIQSTRSPLVFTAEIVGEQHHYYIPMVERKPNLRVFKITRIDFFKYETCITTKYDPNTFSSMHSYFLNARYKAEGDDAEPTFVNQTLMTFFLSNMSIWNLRLCNCKSRFV